MNETYLIVAFIIGMFLTFGFFRSKFSLSPKIKIIRSIAALILFIGLFLKEYLNHKFQSNLIMVVVLLLIITSYLIWDIYRNYRLLKVWK